MLTWARRGGVNRRDLGRARRRNEQEGSGEGCSTAGRHWWLHGIEREPATAPATRRGEARKNPWELEMRAHEREREREGDHSIAACSSSRRGGEERERENRAEAQGRQGHAVLLLAPTLLPALYSRTPPVPHPIRSAAPRTPPSHKPSRVALRCSPDLAARLCGIR